MAHRSSAYGTLAYGARARPVAAFLLGLVATACEIDEITVADVEDVVIAEVYANVAADRAENRILGVLHRTIGPDSVDVDELIAARLTVTRSDGLAIGLLDAPTGDCIESIEEERTAACFVADPAEAAALRPGDLLGLEVVLADGGRLEGASRVPGSFRLPGYPEQCTIRPDTLLPMRWSRSDGAWAYVNETAIFGLPAALRGEGITVEDDPLYLLGLSISDADTTIVFPSEFGTFNRLDLDRDLAVRLQRGLPGGTRAEITITAVDRNYVNWARGGSFNPSGQVRVPSLRGDGTGVFAATVGQRVIVFVSDDPSTPAPPCPAGSP